MQRPHHLPLASDTCGVLQAAQSIMGCFKGSSVHANRAPDSQAHAGWKPTGTLTTLMGWVTSRGLDEARVVLSWSIREKAP